MLLKNSGDPTEKYNFMADQLNSGGSDSIYENFAKLRQSRQQAKGHYPELERLGSASPGVPSEDERLPFGKKRGHVSAMSGVISREDNASNLLFSINESLRKNLSARPRSKKKVEEEIIEELFSKRRDPEKYSDMSNLSGLRRKRPPRKQVRKRRSAFKGVNPNQVYQDISRMKAKQQQRQDLHGRLIDDRCQITKKGRSEIEKLVSLHKTKQSMIYSEIDSAHSAELADTVKPLDFKDVIERSPGKRKLTFGMKLGSQMLANGKVDLEEVQRRVLANADVRREIEEGLREHFEENPMNKSDLPRPKKREKKQKNTKSMKVIKTGKKKEPRKKLKKKKASRSTLGGDKGKSGAPSKKKLPVKRKAKSKKHMDRVLSRYGIPLLLDKEGAEKGEERGSAKKLRRPEKKGPARKKSAVRERGGSGKGGRKDKKERRRARGKRKIKAKNFKGMEKLREKSKFESEDEAKAKKEKGGERRRKKKKISQGRAKVPGEEEGLRSKFGGNLVESETLHSEEGEKIMIKGLGARGNKAKAAPQNHQDQVAAEYQMGAGAKNSFVDKELIARLRNEPSSEDEDLMGGVFSRESNLVNGIHAGLLKKSIQPKFQKDNTVINLNYSGDSEGFIDGNISEKHLSDEEPRAQGSGARPGKGVRESARETSEETEPELKATEKSGSKEINRESLSKIVSGLKNQLSLIESNGGLTGVRTSQSEKVG